ncbi:MAG: exodeoxyribonuclease III [Pseudomonadota bacterium]|nr:exodeoxyribonuclease III [Gammaproteobacteria bacterium]MBU1628638.1 exodeoxyribonuclease III [Gammaproteobacteria bacterium]MBU1926722.1 exodeoxyribonuclease III [Gammaproteobacteria bacterium]MBU2546575.1 exodeoxyribonuclease III [Gammaproteobacteria bacterium]
MKIATWNVNSLRIRLSHVLEWLEQNKPDVLALQETKVVDDKFPHADIEALGYHVIFTGQPTFNGVALLSRVSPQEATTEIEGLDAAQRRVVAATLGSTRVINLYVPNGQSVDSDKYQYKLDWLQTMRRYLKNELAQYQQLIVMGDFNIAPADIDVYDPKAWKGHVLVSEPERQALHEIQRLGLSDVFRTKYPDVVGYTWWDYRAAGFRRNLGMRLDLMLASKSLIQCCKHCEVDAAVRALERPSDHALLFAEFDTQL